MSDTFHLAIIPDGNRRWARKNGLKGYKQLYDRGFQGLSEITETAFEIGVTHLSLWGSSHSNLSERSSEFFSSIDRAFRDNVRKFVENPAIEKYDVHINIIGEWRDSLTPKTVEVFEDAMARTAHRTGRELTILIDYSGTRERTAAVHSILTDQKSDVPTEQLLRSRSWTGRLPDVDLIIRTGAWTDPHNSAGFMSLLVDEAQYSFPELLWPDFTPEILTSIVHEFNERERRHGK
ncbi:MAG: undecaprenyl pyrophosphate synthetase, short-chain Z-isoprenyl diphosphate synthase [Candidatus Saccharibacteria bacterium]|nr:undecaprenyl pyrophosphate synthetase, short-chain Z-isoprenyl diphosphate synthase [Candidatus Saccharibacteria bacterium]